MASASIPSRWKYDVFVSFRGDDIRKSFMDHLYKDLELKGIHAFRDGHLPRGEEISSQLYEAIEESRFLMVIFSKNYASSTWCLRELVKILECKQRGKREHDVMVIYYDIRPDVVRKQTKSYAKAFAKHQLSDRKEVAKWKEALSMAANLCGWDLQGDANGYESKLIGRISETILFNLHEGRLHVGEKNNEDVELINKILHTFIDNMKLMEHVESNKVRMIGICGLGIGKTTLARAVFNLMSIYFEVCCFVADVEGVTKRLGLPQVQRQLISNIEKTTDVNLVDVHQGIMMLKQTIAHRRVLLVIDGVDKREQLDALAGSRDWFSAGSLIIFTSKSENLLCDHMVDSIYKMTPLRNQSEHEIRQLHEEVHELRTFCQEIRQEMGNIHQMSQTGQDTPERYRPGDFIGENYYEGAGEIEAALQTRWKIGVLDGTITTPEAPYTQSEWTMIHGMLVLWIMNRVGPLILKAMCKK